MKEKKEVKEKKENKAKNIFRKIIVTALFVVCIAVVINFAPNYIQDKLSGRTNLIINNSNITRRLEHEVKIDENDVIYISLEDIKNFFDEDIYVDEKYDQIITSSKTKLAAISTTQRQMYVNSSRVNIFANVIKESDTYYLPFSEMKSVYNVDVQYTKDTDIVTIDSLDREQKMANSSKDTAVKYKATTFSKTVDKVKKGESVVVIEEDDGWYKIRTTRGVVGYLKDLANIYNARETLDVEPQIDGKISMVWDYYYSSAPERSGKINGINVISPTSARLVRLGKGEMEINIGTAGEKYISWAHENGYKVWPSVSNEALQDTTSEILNDYKLREALINRILDMVVNYNLDGINIDFENLKVEDKDMFSQFLVELAPRMAEYGKVLSVDVTAPDGGTNWSECYDRNKIGRVVDYIVFMAYDQNGESSTEAGSVAGADWIEVSLKKFTGKQEEVDPEKIILGMPFYTRLWKENSEGLSSNIITMKNINSSLPSGVNKEWSEATKQYYVEYQSDGSTYKMWIEDERSIKEKFELLREYNLAGAAYWQKDFEEDSLWNVIAEEINK